MAHFAELDASGTVLRVLVVDNSKITLANGEEEEDESLGVVFLRSLFGKNTNWKQTSYNGNFRKNYAGIGFAYDPVRDGFIPPRPNNDETWILNEDTLQWESVD